MKDYTFEQVLKLFNSICPLPRTEPNVRYWLRERKIPFYGPNKQCRFYDGNAVRAELAKDFPKSAMKLIGRAMELQGVGK